MSGLTRPVHLVICAHVTNCLMPIDNSPRNWGAGGKKGGVGQNGRADADVMVHGALMALASCPCLPPPSSLLPSSTTACLWRHWFCVTKRAAWHFICWPADVTGPCANAWRFNWEFLTLAELAVIVYLVHLLQTVVMAHHGHVHTSQCSSMLCNVHLHSPNLISRSPSRRKLV